MPYLKSDKAVGRQRNRPLKDYAGQRFGRLVAVSLIERDLKWNAHKWLFRCDCGQDKVISIKDVRSGHTTSCGCVHTEQLGLRNLSHGLSRAPEYKVWKDMRSRCSNKNRSDYKDYGGRGISVCAEWDSFEVFLRDMGARPIEHTIDRVNVNGNYELGNCRWTVSKIQANNKRSNRHITLDGQTRTLQEWCDYFGLMPSKVRYRLKQGWPIESVFSQSDHRK